MISVHFAVTSDGGFGYQGKLPWGSFPEELEIFFMGLYPDRHVLVGGTTWNGLPQSAKDRLHEIIQGTGALVQVVTSKEDILHFINTAPTNDITDFQCIGGAFVLNTIMDEMASSIDKAHISLIYWDWEADVFLRPFEDLLPDLTTIHVTQIIRESDGLKAKHFVMGRP